MLATGDRAHVYCRKNAVAKWSTINIDSETAVTPDGQARSTGIWNSRRHIERILWRVRDVSIAVIIIAVHDASRSKRRCNIGARPGS
jgi:hypothetical protein